MSKQGVEKLLNLAIRRGSTLNILFDRKIIR